MSYEPTNWVTGDIVTAEKLNKIEQGIVDGNVLFVHFTAKALNTISSDKTFVEIEEALEESKVVIGVISGILLTAVVLKGDIISFYGNTMNAGENAIVGECFEITVSRTDTIELSVAEYSCPATISS